MIQSPNRYFGYDIVDNISNQKNQFTRYVSRLIFLAIKTPHKITQNSILLYFYQFIANISHI